MTDALRYLHALTLVAVALSSLIGNISLFVIISKNKNLQTKSNAFILNLAIADILVSSISSPVTVETIIKGAWTHGSTLCAIMGYMTMVVFCSSVLILALISIYRYFYIVRWKYNTHIFTRRKIGFLLLLVWVVSCAISLPPLTGWAKYTFIANMSICFVDWKTNTAYLYFMVALCFCGPLVSMCFSYYKIFSQNRASNRAVNNHGAGNSLSYAVRLRSKDESKLTKTFIIVILCFVVCWFPYVVTIFLDVYYAFGLPGFIYDLALLLGYMKSACNPIIYCTTNTNIREGYKKLFCCLRKKNRVKKQSNNERVQKPENEAAVSLSNLRTGHGERLDV